MVCDDCAIETSKTYWKSSRWVCSDCFGRILAGDPAFLHRKVGNKYTPWLTVAGNDVFTHRDRLPTGELIDKRTGKPSPQITKD